MLEKNNVILKLKNAEGKRVLEKTKLEYSRRIITKLKVNPSILPYLLDTLEFTENDFFSLVSGDVSSFNIGVYDAALFFLDEEEKKIK